MSQKQKRRIIQVLPTLAYGDAVGNDALALQKILRSSGYEECIFAENIGSRVPKENVYRITDWKEPEDQDVIIYHLSVGWSQLSLIRRAKCRKIAVYHNVTPPEFFASYNPRLFDLCRDGLEEVKSLRKAFDYCLADSQFNKDDLVSYGYSCPIDVLPILIPMEDYRKKPDEKTLRHARATDGHNIVFVGRVAPNKKQEDIIAAFTLYQKYYDPKARLFLVGSVEADDLYYARLMAYVDRLKARNVFFTGHVSFAQILAYYRAADVFVCMSEHEGFCVPVVEAMLFEKPILAFDAGAVGSTLGEGGILMKEKDLLLAAGLIDRLAKDEALRKHLLMGQKKQLKKFSYESVGKLFLNYLKDFSDGGRH